MIEFTHDQGYVQATINVGGGREVLDTSYRNSKRCIGRPVRVSIGSPCSGRSADRSRALGANPGACSGRMEGTERCRPQRETSVPLVH
jgi:hypothetical protein